MVTAGVVRTPGAFAERDIDNLMGMQAYAAAGEDALGRTIDERPGLIAPAVS